VRLTLDSDGAIGVNTRDNFAFGRKLGKFAKILETSTKN
jgi:hypothetical protein